MVKHENIRFVTTSTRSRLPSAAVLADSLRRHHPEHKLICYLVEDTTRPEDTCEDRLEIIGVTDINLPGGKNFLFQYTPFELCCALKPSCIMDHLSRDEVDAVVYLDGDMLACAPFLDVLIDAWNEYPILVTPHLRSPETDVNYSYFLKTGIYNAGFIAVRNAEPACEMLQWWRDRLETNCHYDYLGGVFVDQRWLDMAVSSFNAAGPIQHRGINVGHWNLHECDFSEKDEQIMVGTQEPLCIFHFSNFQNPGLTKHENIIQDIPPEIERLADDYEKQLTRMQDSQKGDASYSFDNFKDGNPITQAMREVVRLGLVKIDDPFANWDKIAAALPADDPDSILDHRMDHRVYRLQERCKVLKLQQEHTEEELNISRAHMQRIRHHPIIGRFLTFWNKFINKNLLGGFPE